MAASTSSSTKGTKIIKLRRSVPTSDTRPAPGYKDEIADRLQEVRDGVDAFPADEWAPVLANRTIDSANRLEKVRRLVWTLNDATASALSAQAGFADAQADYEAKALPTTGWSSPADYEAAKATAAKNVRDRAALGARDSVLDAYRDDANDVATAAIAGLEGLSMAIDSAYAMAISPRALRQSVTLEDISRQASIERDITAAKLPMAYAWKLWSGFISRGETEQAEAIQNAAKYLACQTRDAASSKLVGRYLNQRSGTIDDEKELAFRLLRAFEEYDRERVKQASIASANVCFNSLVEIFSVLCGVNAKFLSPAQFAMKYLVSDSSKVDAASPFELDSNWPARYLPPSSFRLPGHSPVIMKTSMGGVVRKTGGRLNMAITRQSRNIESQLGSHAIKHVKAEHVEDILLKFARHLHAHNSMAKIAEMSEEEGEARALKFFERHAKKNPEQAAPAKTVDQIAAARGLSWK